jgi:hypothetical protein
VISNEDVDKLEADQRRPKSAPDNKRSEIIARIVEMRDIERRLEGVRAYVSEWEECPEAAEVLAIIGAELGPTKYPAGFRPDRRKRKIVELYQRFDFAQERAWKLLRLADEWSVAPAGDDDAEDIKRILTGEKYASN